MTHSDQGPRILVVANLTPSTPRLLAQVARRAQGGARFTLIVPPEKHEHHDWHAEDGAQMLGRAAGSDVAVLEPGPEALDTIHAAVDRGEFDEIIVSALQAHLDRWIHHDLPHRLKHLGLPVTVIPPEHDKPMYDNPPGTEGSVAPVLPGTSTGGY